MTRGHLTLVKGFKRLAMRERLIARAAALFPDDEVRQQRWVEAKLFLINKPIKVRIGSECRDITFPRTLREAGITGELA